MPKTKTGPLSKVEIFYIDGNIDDLDVNDIATDLNRSIKSIESYIKKTYKKNSTKSKFGAGEHFIRQKGVTIMSENASTISDANKKTRQVNSQKCVTKIN